MEQLTASLEDYLEVIYNHKDAQKSIRAIDISRKLNISRASVTEALKKLATKELINYGRYDTISLTDKGLAIAGRVANKHNILQTFFEKILDLSSEEASINACKIEHVITEGAFMRISEYLNR